MSSIPDSVKSPVTLARVWEWLVTSLQRYAPDEAAHIAQWLIEDVTGLRRAQRIAQPDRLLTCDHIAALRRMLDRLHTGEPVQYVVGYSDFRGLRLRVSPAVLIPRPETEVLVAKALQAVSSVETPRILDVGTGSGCIALALRDEHPLASVVACDVSVEALAVARDNAERLDLPVQFIEADMRSSDFAARTGGPFNLVVSNPPYVTMEEADSLPSRVRAFEPKIALFAEEEPLQYYRILAQQAKHLLLPAGQLLVEINEAYGQEVVDVCTASGLTNVTLEQDLTGRDRFVAAVYSG